MANTAKIDEEPIQPLEALTQALVNAGATVNESATSTPLPEGEIKEEPPKMAQAPGPIVTRTTALYNMLDMARVGAADFVADIERQLKDEHEDLEAQIEALTKISQRRVKNLMDRRKDALNELRSAEETMNRMVGKA